MGPVQEQRHSSGPCTGTAAQQCVLYRKSGTAVVLYRNSSEPGTGTATQQFTNHITSLIYSLTNHNNINTLIYQSQHQLIYQSQHQLTHLPITTSKHSFPTQTSDFPSTSLGHQSVWPLFQYRDIQVSGSFQFWDSSLPDPVFSTGASKYPTVFNCERSRYPTQFSVLKHQSIQQFLTARDKGIRPSFLFWDNTNLFAMC